MHISDTYSHRFMAGCLYAMMILALAFPWHQAYGKTAAEDKENMQQRTTRMLGELSQWERYDSVNHTFSELLTEAFSTRQTFRQTEPLLTAFLLDEGNYAGKRYLAREIADLNTRFATQYISGLLHHDQVASLMLMVAHEMQPPLPYRALRQAFNKASPSIQAGILSFLATGHHQQSEKFIARQTDADQQVVANAAVAALGKYDSPQAINTLRKLLSEGSHPCMGCIIDALFSIAETLSDHDRHPEAYLLYEEVLKTNPTDVFKTAAISGMASTTTDDPASLLREQISLAPPGSDLRIMLIDLIGNLPEVTYDTGGFADLAGLSDLERMRMITILSHRGDRSIRDDIYQFIDHEEPDLRLAGIQALSLVATAHDVLFMAENAAVKRDREQELFRNALYRLQGADIDATILQEASQLHNNVAVELIKAIAERGIEQATGLLLKKAKSGHPGVRIEACRSLGKISSMEHISQIIDLLADTDTSRERQELERAIFLAATRNEQQMANTKQVQEFIEQTPATRDKASLIAVLGNIKNNEDLPLLLAYLEHEEIDLQLAAIRALTDWPNSRPADKLMTVAGSSPDIRVQTLAIRACSRVILNDGHLSNEMKAVMLSRALELAPNANEKRQVISAMMRTPSFETFETLINSLGDESLKTELELAIVNMAPVLMRIDATKTRSEIERALTMSDNDDLKNLLDSSN